MTFYTDNQTLNDLSIFGKNKKKQHIRFIQQNLYKRGSQTAGKACLNNRYPIWRKSENA